jgi:hypothetical protein
MDVINVAMMLFGAEGEKLLPGKRESRKMPHAD